MNDRAGCTLPAPAKPLPLDTPKPSTAFVQSITDTENKDLVSRI
jgi:hypothetical protein